MHKDFKNKSHTRVLMGLVLGWGLCALGAKPAQAQPSATVAVNIDDANAYTYPPSFDVDVSTRCINTSNISYNFQVIARTYPGALPNSYWTNTEVGSVISPWTGYSNTAANGTARIDSYTCHNPAGTYTTDVDVYTDYTTYHHPYAGRAAWNG